jgi:hypothetical protein
MVFLTRLFSDPWSNPQRKSFSRPHHQTALRLPVLHRFILIRRRPGWRTAPTLRMPTALRRIWPLLLQRHPLSPTALHLMDILSVFERLREVANAACDVLVTVHGKRNYRLVMSV